MSTGIGAWLRKQREARGWARREMARRLTQAALAVGDTTVPGIENLCTYVRRWEFNRHGPTERYVLYYCTAFSISVEEFGTALPPPPPPPPKPKTEAQAPARSRRLPAAPADPNLAASIAAGSELDRLTLEREITIAAHDASDRAERYHSTAAAIFEQLRADLTRLARLCDTAEPRAVFVELRRVRDRIDRLLERQLWPRAQSSMHVLLACINGLMGITVLRLGCPDAAGELIRTGWAYADALHHNPLRASLRAQLSCVMYWTGSFTESRDLAADGLRYVSKGQHAARLHLCHARATARTGDTDAACRAIEDAHDAHDHDDGDDLLDIGGAYGLSWATHHWYAGAALADIGDARREATTELERAIDLYDKGPGEREQHWFPGKPLACIDLAVVRLRSGALDAAATALDPALSLPLAQRITQVTTRLAAVRDELAAPIYSRSSQTRDMAEQIEEFGREAIAAGLPDIPAGSADRQVTA